MNAADEEKNIAELAKAVKKFRDNMMAFIEFNELQAKVDKAKYDAYVKQGFTAQQALYLIKEKK